MSAPLLYIGLMSGTSMDGVDAVLLTMEGATPRVVGHASSAIPHRLRENLHALSHPGSDTIDLMGQADIAVAEVFAEAALQLLAGHNLTPADITALGSHGQTIRHRPRAGHGGDHFTVQIGDPNTIAALTGITTVADFRRKDMALGGEGAPLVPAFHHQVFHHPDSNRAIVNIGGIANITWLPASGNSPVIGYDTGPGNCLMDAWHSRHRSGSFDDGGAWAASGMCSDTLLAALLAEPYLMRAPPKSTGKELFNLPWLDARLAALSEPLPPEDVQATLCAYTAHTIARGLEQLPGGIPPDEVYLCGGGVFNTHLVTSLRQLLAKTPVNTSADRGIHPLHVEAAAFAWLAHRTLNRLPGNLTSVTGARRNAVLGGIYYP